MSDELSIYDPDIGRRAKLQNFLDNFEGLSHSEAVEQSTKIRLYITNHYSIGSAMRQGDKSIVKFVSSIENFLNREWIKSFKWTLDLFREPSDDIKRIYDYDGHQALRKAKSQALMKWFKTKDPVYQEEREKVEDQMRGHPWSKFVKEINAAHRNLVQKRDSHILTKDELRLDDSSVSQRLLNNFEKLIDVLAGFVEFRGRKR
tara:strand:- start:10576 stop:11184 length:609 start_codon:yes stop_codon:yes gene_type:complete